MVVEILEAYDLTGRYRAGRSCPGVTTNPRAGTRGAARLAAES